MNQNKLVKTISLPIFSATFQFGWLPILLGGYIVFNPSFSLPSVAQDIPSPPLIIEELPPGPNELDFPSQEPPTITPEPREYEVPTVRPLPNSSPSTPIPNSTNTYSDYYRVEVEGDSSFLLTQIQDIEPEAFIRGREGTIQAGLFSERYNAQRRAKLLESEGFQARVVPIDVAITRPSSTNYPEPVYRPVQPSSPVNSNNSTIPTAINSSNSNRENNDEKGYFVVIPGSQQDLPTIAAKVAESGINLRSIRQKNSPIGSHVAVGPFATRSLAERWNSYLRWAGMDARLHHR